MRCASPLSRGERSGGGGASFPRPATPATAETSSPREALRAGIVMDASSLETSPPGTTGRAFSRAWHGRYDWTPDLRMAAVELVLRYGPKGAAGVMGLTYEGLRSALHHHGIPLRQIGYRRAMARAAR